METDSQQIEISYSPLAVLNLFNNALSINQSKKLIQVRGVFISGKGTNYSGFYYDSLKDEASDAQLTIIVPGLIRNDLQHGKVVLLNGFVTKRVVNSASRIEIQVTITDILGHAQHKFSEEDIKMTELLQRKAAIGFRDVHYWIKDHLLNDRIISIAIIIGKNAIIDNDIKHQLKEAIGFYSFTFHRINLSAENEIIAALDEMEAKDFDIIAVSRGGGENLSVFNKLELAERSISLKPLFVTAIGHKDDVTLLQRVADKAFITPSEMGQFFNEVYNQVHEEMEHSRAKLVSAITTQLNANYKKQIDNLNDKLKAVEELKEKNASDLKKVYDEQLTGLNKQIEQIAKSNRDLLQKNREVQEDKIGVMDREINSLKEKAKGQDSMISTYKSQLATSQAKGSTNLIAIIIAVIIGIVIGIAIHSK